MAGYNEEIAIKIGAKDNASKVIDNLVKKIDGMEADEARITVTAQTDKLQDQLDRARIKLGTLTGDEYSVQARMVGTLEEDLEQSKKLLADLDGKTATVKVESSGIDTVKTQLDGVESSGKASSVAIGGIGNAVSELPGVGAMGPLAESMGQMAETALEGGENIAAMGAAFGVLGGAAVIMAGINDIMSKMAQGKAATKAFDEDQIKIFNEALVDGERAAQNYKEALQKAGEILAVTGTNAGPAWTNIIPGVNKVTDFIGVMGGFGDKIRDIVPLLDQAGVSADIWTQTVTSEEPVAAMGELREALKQTTLSTEDQHAILIAAKGAQDDFATSTDNASTMTRIFGTEVDETTGSHQRSKKAVDDNRAALDRHRDALNEAKTATDNLKRANQELRGDLDNRQFLLNIIDTFGELKTKASDTWDWVKGGADNSAEAVRLFELDQIAAKQQVLDYIDALGNIPPEKEAAIITAIDEGRYVEAVGMIEDLTKEQTVDVRFNVIRPKSIGVGSAGGGGVPVFAATSTSSTGAPMAFTSHVSEVVLPVRLQLPSAAQISRQIGPLNLAIKAGLTANERLTGIRS